MALVHLLLRRLKPANPNFSLCLLRHFPNSPCFSSLSVPDPTNPSPAATKPSSLSARMSFIFEQIDEIDKNRQEKDQTLQRIRAWRESKRQQGDPALDQVSSPTAPDSVGEELRSELAKSEEFLASGDAKKEVELVHQWPEWIELMERLMQQNYFDDRRKDEEGMIKEIGFDLPEAAPEEDRRRDFTRSFKAVQSAIINFGRDRFDILRPLSRQDLQVLVGYGCPSADNKVVFSAKLLRKLVHLNEGDVCSSCSLRNSCVKAYLLTNKEDEAHTIDVMRILLTYGFGPNKESVINKSILKLKSVKTVVRKLLHEVVKLSAVPIDPNLPPPVIKRPPPKVKQPPPPPRKKVGRYDVEMKKGDWLCPKCEFLNFAKNTVCLHCDAKRPKRQLLPGEWECPQCNFLNYRRNMACFHCEHKRPPDTYTENPFPERQRGPRISMDKINRKDISNAWNFDFDDDESDGADVAAFEYADSKKLDEDFPLSKPDFRESSRGHEDGIAKSSRPHKGPERNYSNSGHKRHATGFNDFDEEDDDDDVNSYELDTQNGVREASRVVFSELEADSESEDVESIEDNWHTHGKTQIPRQGKKQMRHKTFNSDDDEVDFDTDDDLPIHPDWKSSHVADNKRQSRGKSAMKFNLEDDLEFSSGTDEETTGSRNKVNRNVRPTGQRSSFRAESFSRADSDKNLSHRSHEQRKGKGTNNRGKTPRGLRAVSFSEADSDDDMSHHRHKQRRGTDLNHRGRSQRSLTGTKSNKKNSLDRGFGRSRTQGRSNSFDNKSDSYLDDERYQRARNNVR